MKKNTIWKYIQIGTDLRFLQDINPNHKILNRGGVIENIKRLLKDMSELNLDVTLRGSEELKEYLKKLEEEVKVERDLTKVECEDLKKILVLVRHTMSAEANGIFAYITSEKRYDTTKLLDHVDKLFSPSVYMGLPKMAQYDFEEAGKCIALERATAGAFHILRATEVIVRNYYKKYLRKNPEGKTWGQLLGELKNKNSGKKPNPVTINHLINIKDAFRNPTQHPDKVYDIEEVQDLLNLCIDVVNKMIKEII